MEATKVKVRERDLAVCRHRTWHRILFLPPPLRPPPLTPRSSPLPPRLDRPRTRFGIPVFRPASKTTPSYRKIELLVKTASFVEQGYITSRVSRYRCPRFTACTSISISTRDYRPTTMRGDSSGGRGKKKKNKNEARLVFSFFFFSFSSIKGQIRYPRIDNWGAGRHRGRVGYAMAAWMMNFYI